MAALDGAVGEFFKVVRDFVAQSVKNLYATLVPSMVASSPESIKARRSLQPPTKMLSTNTIGKVGQPAHIF